MGRKLEELADKRNEIGRDYKSGRISRDQYESRTDRVNRDYSSWASHYGRIAESERYLRRENDMEREEG